MLRRGFGGRIGIRTLALASIRSTTKRFATASERLNKTTIRYGPRFATASENNKQNQQQTKSHPFRQYIVLRCSPLFGIPSKISAFVGKLSFFVRSRSSQSKRKP